MNGIKNGFGILCRLMGFSAILFISGVLSTAGCQNHPPKDPLTKEERAWLTAHDGKIVLAHDPSAKPIDYLDEAGRFRGLAADYVHLIESKLNFRFNIARIKTWSEVLQKARRKEVDVLCAVTKTPAREEWLLFTTPYIVVPTVILVRENIEEELTPEKMKGMKVTFTKGWVIEDYLREKYGYLNFVPSIDEEAAMDAVSTGQADAWVTTLTTSSILIQKHKITNLRVAGEIGLEFKLAFASRKDWPILNRILQKGLSLIDGREKAAIFNRWIHVQGTGKNGIGKKAWIAIAVVAGFILLGIIMTLLWNWTLRQQVGQRTVALRKELEEHKRTEQALLESEARFTAFFDHSPMGLLIWDAGDPVRYVAINDTLARLNGLSAKDHVGKTIAEVFPDKTVARDHEALLRDVVITKKPVTHESSRVSADGGEIYYIAQYFPIIGAKREVIAIGGAVMDISLSKKAEKELEEAVLWQREVVRAGNVGLWDWDLLNNKVTYSREWKRQIGYEEHEIGDGFDEWQDRIHPDDLESTLALVNRSIANLSQNHYSEFRFRHKDGSYRWIASQASILTDEEGRPIRMLGSHFDITERKEAEQALLESKRRFEDLAEMLPEAVFEADVNMKLTYANHRALSLFGYTEQDFKNGLNGFDMLVPEHRERAMDKIKKRFQGKPLPASEYSGLKKDGTTFPVLLHAIPILQDGKVEGVRGVIIDISEIKHLESQLQQAHKMEAIGNLAGGIAHEFNNVLGIILGNAELALEDVPDWNPAKASLKEIRTASFRAKEVVTQILSFARKTMTALKPLEINAIVKEALRLVRASIPTMIDIQTDVPSEPKMVLGDSTEIHQIIINLCTNAAHAMKHKGGVIHVSISEERLDERAAAGYEDINAGDFVKLTVKDSGEGIPSDILEKIFEPYFTTKEFGAGSGMGLAVVYGIVKKCKGAISIRSTVGEGTLVEILFPEIKDPAPKAAEATEMPEGNEKILMVDDDPSIATMISQMLESLGYTVTGRTDSAAALALFQSNPDQFDLVITDMAMPKMSGTRLAAELMKIRKDVPILLCTGHSDTVDENKAKQMGIKGFAMKPLDKDKLARAVRAVLDGK